MKKLILVLFLGALYAACASKDKIPRDILPPEKMREVLWDMTRAGEFLAGYVLLRDSSIDKAAESQKWYQKVYDLHQVSEARFKKSFAYYQEHPMLLKAIFDSLAGRQVTARAPQPVADSTANAEMGKADSVRKRDTLRRKSIIDSLRKRKIIRKAVLDPV
jgi:hypothetical protein